MYLSTVITHIGQFTLSNPFTRYQIRILGWEEKAGFVFPDFATSFICSYFKHFTQSAQDRKSVRSPLQPNWDNPTLQFIVRYCLYPFIE